MNLMNLGNRDYVTYVSIDENGAFDVDVVSNVNNEIVLSSTIIKYSYEILDDKETEVEKMETLAHELSYEKSVGFDYIQTIVNSIERDNDNLIVMEVASDTAALMTIIEQIDKYKGKVIKMKGNYDIF